jgi:hypothetical protein
MPQGRYHDRVTTGAWRCPLCNALADEARAHLADVHGVGSDRDRFGLRDAAKRQPARPKRDPDQEPDAADGGPARTPTPFEPPVWRRIPPAPKRGRSSRSSSPAGDDTSEPPLTWRKAPRPASARPARRDPSEAAPSRPVPLPPEAAVLRLVCASLDGVDAQALRDRLLALQGVESVSLDLYAGIVDLYLDRRRATASHLVAMARERVRLPVRAAELHRAAEPGHGLSAATLLFVVQ